MMRRGILGALGAVGVGRAVEPGEVRLPPAAEQGPAIGAGYAGPMQRAVGYGRSDPAKDPRWAEVFQRLDAAHRERRRREADLALTGGVPPGVLVCRSWKPWFQVAAARRWRDEHLPDSSLLEGAIKLAVFGPNEGSE